MSFSSDVKKELAGHTEMPKHCALAQLSAMSAYAAEVTGEAIIFRGDDNICNVINDLIGKCFSGSDGKLLRSDDELRVTGSKLISDILMAIKWIHERGAKPERIFSSGVLLKNDCCKKAFLRGAFLCAGSVNDPHGAYHLEIVCKCEEEAAQLLRIMNSFSSDAKATPRKGKTVCYIKDAERITDMLNVMGAVVSQMEFFNTMILKDMRNDLNRKVNCETANLKKTVSAAVKQIRDIEFIRDTKGLSFLNDNLKEMALLRLENPDMSLKGLGELLDPPLGRSGVNHRLKAIERIAEELRGE